MVLLTLIWPFYLLLCMPGYLPSEARCTASFFLRSAFGSYSGFLTIWDLERENEGMMEVKSGLHGLK